MIPILQMSKLRFRLPRWLSSKESTCQCKRCSLIPGSGRSPGGGHGNPLQYSGLENPMDRGAWWATVHCVDRTCTHAYSIDTGKKHIKRSQSKNNWLKRPPIYNCSYHLLMLKLRFALIKSLQLYKN